MRDKNSKKIDLSIILPAYNVEKYVKKSLDSILSQNGINYEIIIVNDGSKDGTLETIRGFFEEDIRVKIIDQKNQGSGYARNTGLSYAQGEYVYFMDPDDLIKPEMFHEIFSNLESIESLPDVILFSFEKIDENGNIAANSSQNKEKKYFGSNEGIMNDIDSIYFENLFFSPWTKFIKRDFLNNNNLKFTNQKTGQDALFCIDLFNLASSLLWLPESYYLYLVGREGSAQSKKNPQMALDESNILKKLSKLLNEKNVRNKDKILSEFIVNRSFKELRNIPTDDKGYRTFKKSFKSSVFNESLNKVRVSTLSPIGKMIFFIRKSLWLSYVYFLYKNKL